MAAIPLLWVLPLALYLLTFIICFSRQEWRWSPAFLALPPLAIAGLAYASSSEFHNAPINVLIPLICSGLFIVCLFCHGELARRKPGARYLTSFYLTMSFGGALGGLFVALIAPRIFNNYYELQIGIGVAALLALWLLYREPGPDPRQYGWLTLGAMTVGLLVWLAKDAGAAAQRSSLLERSFYGVLHVISPDDPSDEGAVRSLTNGTIMHGEQFTDPAREMEPISYYAPVSGAGLAVKEAQRHGPVKIGVVGLGTGTIAAYGRAGDQVRYYELTRRCWMWRTASSPLCGRARHRSPRRWAMPASRWSRSRGRATTSSAWTRSPATRSPSISSRARHLHFTSTI